MFPRIILARPKKERKEVRWTLRVEASLDDRLLELSQKIEREPQDVIRLAVKLLLADGLAVAADRLNDGVWNAQKTLGAEHLREVSHMLLRLVQRVETLQEAQARLPVTEGASEAIAIPGTEVRVEIPRAI